MTYLSSLARINDSFSRENFSGICCCHQFCRNVGVAPPRKKGEGGGGKGGAPPRVILDERYFRNLKKFEGTEDLWAPWIFNLTTQVAGVSQEVSDLMTLVRKWKVVGANEEKIKGVVKEEKVEMYGGELFRILANLTKGEANTVDRSAVVGS